MSESNKSYRFSVNVGQDKNLNIPLVQDYENFEFLTLNLTRENIYRLHTSNYGCVAGRVLANDAFGIPNAKVSIFVKTEESEDADPILRSLYPYEKTSDENDEHIRYNLLPDSITDDICHQNIGTFPNKRLVLDDNNVLEIYDTYYKYTTVTNDAGDYMIFGVPVGQQTVHVDIDLSDIGRLSQTPRDMIFKGYNVNQFESTSKFKKDTNLTNLVQVISEDSVVDVKPFWGDDSEAQVAITRNDVKIRYKFDTYCVFMGSVITDDDEDFISKRCIPSGKQGSMDSIRTGQGTIEMIRKTTDGDVEAFSIQGTKLIDGAGTWCYQIPMNLDYVGTDEYGNIVATNDPTKGIATRAEVRFRISMLDHGRETHKLPKVLVPNNPSTYDEMDYAFGTYTKEDSFRNLFYNNVYSIKSFIPRLQKGNNQLNKRFTGIKTVNGVTDNNRFPYNNMRVQMKFMFVLMCAILKMLIRIVRVINGWRSTISKKNCIVLGDGLCPDLEGWYFAPGCKGDKMLDNTLKNMDSDDGGSDKQSELTDSSSVTDRNKDERRCLTGQITYLMECVEINLAMEYDVINFDFYNDWVNGTVYMPRWYGAIRKKNSYLFGLIKIKEKVRGCLEDTAFMTRRYTQQCALEYKKGDGIFYDSIASNNGCGSGSALRCHKTAGRKYVKVFGGNGGLVHKENTLKQDNVYYLKPCEFGDSIGNYGKRNILFATDIILLGSLSEHNDNGIPLFYNLLPSTSYQLPTNLAATSMDSEGYVFGMNNGGSTTVCEGQPDSEKNIIQVPNTTEDYNTWANGNGEEGDTGEVSVTEAAGIDWGYNGPNQETVADELYYPSGHFLGIGCAVAETNIKSCVNLVRACELGTGLSQRQEIVKKVTTTGGVEYSYVVPSGLINKYDIENMDLRRMFATLNYNKLNTKIDEESLYPKYDFISSMINGFDGVLNEKTLGSSNYHETSTPSGDDHKKINENSSADYFRYRLGVYDDHPDEIKSKYLIESNGKYALPTYENSFYFYFGLTKGQTAHDRLMNDYYSVCQKDENYIPTLDLETKTDSRGCNDDGEALFSVNKYEGIYTIRIYDRRSHKYLKFKSVTSPWGDKVKAFELDDANGSKVYNTRVNNFGFKGLADGKYTVSITTFVDKKEYSRQFQINNVMPQELEGITPIGTNFTGEVWNEGKSSYEKQSGGTITFMHSQLTGYSGYLKITVSNTNGYSNSWVVGAGSSSNVIVTTGIKTDFYVRDGNSTYYVKYTISCDGVTKDYMMKGSIFISMPMNLDYYIGSPNYVTGRLLKKAGINTSKISYLSLYSTVDLYDSWVFDAMVCTGLSDTQKWYIEKSIVNPYVVKDSVNISKKIPFGNCFGNGLYSPYILKGHGENVGSDSSGKVVMHDGLTGQTSSLQLHPNLRNGDDGFSVNHNNFIFSNYNLFQDITDGNKTKAFISIDYGSDQEYNTLCKYKRGSKYRGGMPYEADVNIEVTDSGGTVISTATTVVLPSVNIPMYGYSVFQWGDASVTHANQDETLATVEYHRLSVNGGVGYPDSYYTYEYCLSDPVMTIGYSDGSSGATYVMEPNMTKLVNGDRIHRRMRLLNKNSALTEATHVLFKNSYNSSPWFKPDLSKTIIYNLDTKEGCPTGFTDTNDIKMRRINNNISAKFVDGLKYHGDFTEKSGSETYGYNDYRLIIDDFGDRDMSENVRYFIANEKFIKDYMNSVDHFDEYLNLGNIQANYTWGPITSTSSSDATIRLYEITEDIKNGMAPMTYGVIHSNARLDHTSGGVVIQMGGNECWIVAIANVIMSLDGDIKDPTSDFYKACKLKQGIDKETNYTTLMYIYPQKKIVYRT